MNLSETTNLEQKVNELEAQIFRLNEEKSKLLSEFNHRVVNNIQTITSLLDLFANINDESELTPGVNLSLSKFHLLSILFPFFTNNKSVSLGLIATRLADELKLEHGLDESSVEIASDIKFDVHNSLRILILLNEVARELLNYKRKGDQLIISGNIIDSTNAEIKVTFNQDINLFEQQNFSSFVVETILEGYETKYISNMEENLTTILMNIPYSKVEDS